MTRPVLLTGATGFLGREVARELAGHGYALHALAREESRREVVAVPVTWHTGDLTDRASVEAAVAAVAATGDEPALVHAAAVISYRDEDAALQRAVNVEGTRVLLDAARRHGFTAGVHVSSVVAVAHSPDGSARDEYAEWNGAELEVDYVTTKHEAEVVARGFAKTLGLRIVNPGVIFGGGGEANSSRFLLALARGELGPFAPPGGISVVGVEDAARGVWLALERGEPGRRYVLAESYLGMRDLFRAGASCLGVEGIRARAPRATVPRGLWPAVVAGSRHVARFRPVEHATPQALRMLGCRWRLSGDRARRELGWRPAPFDDVLLETVRGLVRAGRLS